MKCSGYPISLFMETIPTPEQVAGQITALKKDIADQEDSVYVQEHLHSKLAKAVQAYKVELIPGNSRVIWGHPGKLMDYDEDSDMMKTGMVRFINAAARESRGFI